MMKLKVELERTFANLERKNEILINSMTKNFGKTQQDLPNFKLPEIQASRGHAGKKSLTGIQTDVLGMDSLYGAAIHQSQLEVAGGKSAGILKKTLTSVTKSYQPKR